MELEDVLIGLLVFLILFYISMIMHEVFHFIVLILLGGDGFIDWSRWCVVQTAPSLSPDIVRFSGGILSGCLFIAVFLIIRRYFDFDETVVFLLLLVGAYQILIGLAEGLRLV